MVEHNLAKVGVESSNLFARSISPPSDSDRPVLGWRECVSLPELGVGSVLAKLDTGAFGSVIHATDIVLQGPPEAPGVRFVLHPSPDQPGLTVACAAPLLGRRRVTSSNGRSERRPVVRTWIQLGPFGCPAEVSLTARPLMRHRMLIGRAVLGRLGVVVDPMRDRLALAP